MCEEEEHSVTNTIKLVERETKTLDPIEDMEKYIHTVLDSDDKKAKKCKLEHNTVLAINTQMHIIHDNLEHLSDLEKNRGNGETIRSQIRRRFQRSLGSI